MNVKEYIGELQKQYATGVAREHSYRPALQNLLATMLPQLIVTNEPARIDCGAPDYILSKNGVPIAFVEAKDIDDSDLGGRKQHKEQFDRYRKSLDTLIITDYLDFCLYEYGELIDSTRIGETKGDKINLIKSNEAKFIQLINRFGNATPQRITSSVKLAEQMASKARLLADVIQNSLEEDERNNRENQALWGQLQAFKRVLIHDITPKSFADIYAQTIAYGMFAARLHDKTPETFSRLEAATLIPKTNPFLRQIFQNIAGFDLDDRISWIVDDLAETFRATDMDSVMKNFGKRTRQNDPMIHFYEDFLKAYDPSLRKSRGVWYTPQPVVNFIVRAVDEILQTEFGLPMGLADTSKVKLERSVEQSKDKRYTDNKKKELREYHKVQILDPATGTGTFLAETVSQIYERFRGQGGMWQGYVEEHLLPRLNGFELLMASYTMAHLKLDLLLEETGYTHRKDERLRIYLTNSLEEVHKDTGTLFAQWLANEANEANRIKQDTPVMVVIGNPPYSGESSNKSRWIMDLMEDYKKEPGGKIKLKERNPKWINDDYCKFIRFGQYFVDKNTEGVLAYINNHSFIDNPTFRGMRWNLMKSFDKIYIIDLHGNSKKKETAPDGSKDENVFDIQQGVSINLFIKTGKKEAGQLAEVYHYDLFGKRESKYQYLSEHNFDTVKFNKLQPSAPEYFFVPKDYSLDSEYKKGFSITDLFSLNSAGIVTAKDKILISINKKKLLNNIAQYYGNESDDEYIKEIDYRPFDKQYIYYDTSKIERSREKIMHHLTNDKNLALATIRINKEDFFSSAFISRTLVDARLSDRFLTYVFPLYLYPADTQLSIDGELTRKPNLDPKVVEKISKKLKYAFVPEKDMVGDIAKGYEGTFAPIDLLDYIYAVLHSPSYREKYKEFLKTDFPRVPYPDDAERFWELVQLGGELRQYHLLEHPMVNTLITTYPVAGDNTVGKLSFELKDESTGKVWINDTQYFDSVPLTAWEFYIGGYQPAQKWLKDRKDRMLTFDDIMHYQRMITALINTDRIMKEIDKIITL